MQSLLSSLNWLHILVGAIAYFILGAIWYSVLFGKKWIHYHKIDVNAENAKKGMVAIMVGSFILEFIIVAGIGILVTHFHSSTAFAGLHIGLFTGLLFSATAISITYLYLQKSLALHLIDGLYHIVSQIIAAILLSIWQ